MVNILFLRKFKLLLLVIIALSFYDCFALKSASETENLDAQIAREELVEKEAYSRVNEMAKLFDTETQTGAHLQALNKMKIPKDYNYKTEVYPIIQHFLLKLNINVYHPNQQNASTEKWPYNFFQDNDFFEMVKRIADQENNYAKSHYVFYHGMHSAFVLIQDIIKVFLKEFRNIELPQDLAVFRLPYKDFELYKEVNALVAAGGDDDKNLSTRKTCISAGPALFSCISARSESPMKYFISPDVYGGGRFFASNLSIKSLLKEVFDCFDLGEYFENDGLTFLQKLLPITENPINKYIKAEDNWMAQFFIPKEITNKYVWNASSYFQNAGKKKPLAKMVGAGITEYGSWTRCLKCRWNRHSQMKTCGCDKTEQEITIAEFLDVYKTKPKDVPNYNNLFNANDLPAPEKALDQIAVRIYLHPDVFHDQKSGVKVFRHTRVPKSKDITDKYFQELETFASALHKKKASNEPAKPVQEEKSYIVYGTEPKNQKYENQEKHLSFNATQAFIGDNSYNIISRDYNNFCNNIFTNEVAPSKSPGTFRIMSFNVHNFHKITALPGTLRKNPEYAAQAIGAMKPDIVALQEIVPYVKTMDEALTYEGGKPVSVDFSFFDNIMFNMGFSNNIKVNDFEKNWIRAGFMGKAIYTKEQIEHFYSSQIGQDLGEERGYVAILFKYNEKSILLYNVHLSFNMPEITQGEVRELVESIEKNKEKFQTENVIIIGDFNNNPYNCYGRIFDAFALINKSYVLLNDSKPSAFNQNVNTGETIDLIYVSQGFLNNFEIMNQKSKINDQKFSVVVKSDASDHFPVYIDFKSKEDNKFLVSEKQSQQEPMQIDGSDEMRVKHEKRNPNFVDDNIHDTKRRKMT